MKRIISTIFAVVTLIALTAASAVMTVNAGWTAPTTITNTNQLFNTDHHFYATKGSPKVDGIVDDSWSGAYTLSLNATRRVDPTSNVPASLMTNVYVMWDETNLYILDVYEYDIPVYGPDLTKNWSTDGKDCSLYYIVLPNEMTSKGMGAVNMPHLAPGDLVSGDSAPVPSNVFSIEV